jgi:hypothetical protein
MVKTIDIQKVSGAGFMKATDQQVKTISAKCVELQEKEEEITTIEENLKKAKKDALFLSEETIPNLLTEAGISSLDLADGTSVKIAPFYSARISKERQEEAFKWLRDNNHADLIRNNVGVSFTAGDDVKAQTVLELLKTAGHRPVQKQEVNAMQLKQWAREQIEEGIAIPHDLFSVYVANRTKIKTKEKL